MSCVLVKQTQHSLKTQIIKRPFIGGLPALSDFHRDGGYQATFLSRPVAFFLKDESICRTFALIDTIEDCASG
jgi:hypothetical protein